MSATRAMRVFTGIGSHDLSRTAYTMLAPMDAPRSSADARRPWYVPRTLYRFMEQSAEMRPVSLRFLDPALETDYGQAATSRRACRTSVWRTSWASCSGRSSGSWPTS